MPSHGRFCGRHIVPELKKIFRRKSSLGGVSAVQREGERYGRVSVTSAAVVIRQLFFTDDELTRSFDEPQTVQPCVREVADS